MSAGIEVTFGRNETEEKKPTTEEIMATKEKPILISLNLITVAVIDIPAKKEEKKLW